MEEEVYEEPGEVIESVEDNNAFMCGKCFQLFSTMIEVEAHDCTGEENYQEEKRMAIREGQENEEEVYDAPEINNENVVSSIEVLEEAVEVESPRDEVPGDLSQVVQFETGSYSNQYNDDDNDSDEMVIDGPTPKKRRKMNHEYRLNRLTRDPFFKLDRNFYTFKDTLGDWDEKSTRLLIDLMGKYPKAHFLLPRYFERRLVHWEVIHSHMLNAGYTFTVLQLRMRWREVLAKYRWTLNHNDLYELSKTCEYFDEMNKLFGVWPHHATDALLRQIELMTSDGPNRRQKRLGYQGWEKITAELSKMGFNFTILQVEARWRMLVTTYKSMVDHNIMPTVEPIFAAFSDRLQELVTYEPRRRRDYERSKGKKVTLERFPETAMKCLIRTYGDNMHRFNDPNINNALIWDDIRQTMDSMGYSYTCAKLKEIFFASLKLYERCVQHNSMPGAIRREGSYYKELSQLLSIYGYWPHTKRRRKTMDEKTARKFKLRLKLSMQLWRTHESRGLLQLYPDVLENFVSQMGTFQQPSDLWLQVAHAYSGAGFPKRDIPEIAIHIGLLRMGYAQGNRFPFNSEMQRVMEVEETLCYSPDVSTFTGDVEIVYWSHEAVLLLLDMYLEIQPQFPYSSFSDEVFTRIMTRMHGQGYSYDKEQIKEQFRSLLVQFSTRRHLQETRLPKQKKGRSRAGILYEESMREVLDLRAKLSLSFTNGVKPIPQSLMRDIVRVASETCEDLLFQNVTQEEQKANFVTIIQAIRKYIRVRLQKKPPMSRKVCYYLLKILTEVEFENNPDLIRFKEQLGDCSYEVLLTDIMKDVGNGNFGTPRSSALKIVGHGRHKFSHDFDDMDLPDQEGDAIIVENIRRKRNHDGELKVEGQRGMSWGGKQDTDRRRKELPRDLYGCPTVVGITSMSQDDLKVEDDGTSPWLELQDDDGAAQQFQKWVIVNESLGTMTTVLPKSDETELTEITIADIDVKKEPEEQDSDEPLGMAIAAGLVSAIQAKRDDEEKMRRILQRHRKEKNEMLNHLLIQLQG